MIFVNLAIYVASFTAIWIGAGMVISSVDKISRKLKLSSFAVSFLLLGVLTTIPELAVGITALVEKTPEIFVGNLIGGIPAIFLMIIPILAIFGDGINLERNFGNKTFVFVVLLMVLPAVFILNGEISIFESVFLIVLYFVVLYLVQKNHGVLDKNGEVLNSENYSYKNVIKIAVGVVLVFASSHFIVEKTVYFGEILRIPTFYLSLVILSIGTNIPELSMAVRSVVMGKKDIAFGNYMGSGSANALLFGVLSLISKEDVVVVDNFLPMFVFIIVGMGMFFFFSRSRNNISRKEGFLLMVVYALFVAFGLAR